MEWISVEDRLPENNDDVICVHKADKWVSLGCYDCGNNRWYDVCGSLCRIKVTHWMPLPPPPKEDNQ